MIIDEFVKIKINSRNYNHFKKIGYNVEVGSILDVKTKELMKGSSVKINVKCDICGKTKKIKYQSYLKNISKYPIYCCNTSCAKIKEYQTKKEIYGDNYEEIRIKKMKSTNYKKYGNENSSQIFRNEKNQDVFINELKDIYKDDSFDYSKINYINNYTNVEIICEKHGSFNQRPNELLIGRGCSKCNKERERVKYLEKYIKKSNKVHNNKYDYSLVDYKGCEEKVKIICPIHGIFYQSMSLHSNNRGCPDCANISRRLKLLKRIAENIENGYQISPSFNKKACEVFDNISEKENINIQHAMNGGEYYISSLGYWLDGYDVENNIAYEYDEKEHFINGKLKSKDIKRQKEITKLLNCKFIRIEDS